jgi:hypothetical protein
VKRTLVAVALVVVFVMALAAPTFAQTITHTATYEMDGAINFKKQMGHLCNTGAEVKQTIMGSGQMDKVQTVSLVRGKITMEDANDYVAGATPLTVTTVWELCTPPKYIYDNDTYDGVVHPNYLYRNGFTTPRLWTAIGWDGYDVEELVDFDEFEAVSSQIWAVQVQADPGYSGNLHQSGVAAYGRFDGVGGPFDDDDALDDLDDESWGWENAGMSDAVVGPDYVGDYFTMNQHARTSMGTLKRFINISSPWSHGYLMEDMSVTGRSDITEAFALHNLPAGVDVPGLWYDLF